MGSVTGFGLTPIAMLGLDALAAEHDRKLGDAPADGLVILEASLLSMDVNQIVKFAAGRERPFVHALTISEKTQTAHPSDNNVSFYSGHTTFAFSLAVAGGTVATMRGYRWAPAIWIAGLGLATFTGYLRIAADCHYLTDVLTGAVAGFRLWFRHSLPIPFAYRLEARVTAGPRRGLFRGGTWRGAGGAW